MRQSSVLLSLTCTCTLCPPRDGPVGHPSSVPVWISPPLIRKGSGIQTNGGKAVRILCAQPPQMKNCSGKCWLSWIVTTSFWLQPAVLWSTCDGTARPLQTACCPVSTRPWPIWALRIPCANSFAKAMSPSSERSRRRSRESLPRMRSSSLISPGRRTGYSPGHPCLKFSTVLSVSTESRQAKQSAPTGKDAYATPEIARLCHARRLAHARRDDFPAPLVPPSLCRRGWDRLDAAAQGVSSLFADSGGGWLR